MQKSSQQIGAIAAALAKAQAQLANPEKTLTATLPSSNPREGERSFRYASLASGLDIVRKALGGNEIAIIQTTAVERRSKVIQLTTTLAHSSGEWFSTEWPVCPAEETANPQRLGTALTYARRYALFALVGIAGEDDLDAPNLPTTGKSLDRFEHSDGVVPGNGIHARDASPATEPPKVRHPHKPSESRPRTLTENASAELQERLLTEIHQFKTSEDAAEWVHKRLADRDKLASSHAQAIETEFAKKISSLGDVLFPDLIDDEPALLLKEGSEGESSNNSSLPIALKSGAVRKDLMQRPIRLKDREHCKFVSRQPCVVCGRSPTDPHHLRFAQPRALGRKVSDEYTVPVCRTHHRELHRYGDEMAWWTAINVDPTTIALNLWQRSRSNLE